MTIRSFIQQQWGAKSPVVVGGRNRQNAFKQPSGAQLWGSQFATVYPDYIDLDHMWMVEPATICSETLGRLEGSLLKHETFCSSEDRPASTLELLRKVGFTGSGEFVETEFGFLFPQLTVPQAGKHVIAVATGVTLVCGAPGLLLKRNYDGRLKFHDVGIFIGPVPRLVKGFKFNNKNYYNCLS